MAYRCEYCTDICFDDDVCKCKGKQMEARVAELEGVLLEAHHAICNCSGSSCHTVIDLIDEKINP